MRKPTFSSYAERDALMSAERWIVYYAERASGKFRQRIFASEAEAQVYAAAVTHAAANGVVHVEQREPFRIAR